MKSRKRSRKPAGVRKGVCHSCGKSARGGTRRRHGIETILLCPSCAPAPKSERELYLDHDQAERLLKASQGDPRMHLVVRLGISCGLRISEIVTLKAEAFNWSRKILFVKTLKRKGHPEKPVYLSEDLAEELKLLIGDRRGFLFPRRVAARGKPIGGHIDRTWAARLWKRLAEEVGLPERMSSHSMRHHFAIALLESTGDVYFTSRQCRHAKIETTERYLHLLPDRAREKANLVPLLGARKK